MKQLLTMLLALLSATAMGQRDQGAIIQRENAAADERRYQKLKEEGSRPNTPGPGSGSSVTKEDADAMAEILTGGKAARQKYEQQERVIRAEQAESDRRADVYKNAMHAEHDAAVREQAGIDRQAVAMQKQFIEDGMANRPRNGVPENDFREELGLQWFEKKYAWKKLDLLADRSKALSCLKRFEALKGVATYDTLLALAGGANLYPRSANVCLRFLKERFPEQIVRTEKAILANHAYFLGAGMPYLTPYNATTGYYSKCIWEDETPVFRGGLLKRFMELAKKYPEEARKAAGACRPHLIPFNIAAKGLCEDDSCRAEMYMHTIRMQMADQHKNDRLEFGEDDMRFGNEAFWDFNVLRMGDAAQWLVEHRLSALQAFSKEDWEQIAAEKHMNMYNLSWLFRDRKSDDPNTYKHLKIIRSMLQSAEKEQAKNRRINQERWKKEARARARQ